MPTLDASVATRNTNEKSGKCRMGALASNFLNVLKDSNSCSLSVNGVVAVRSLSRGAASVLYSIMG